MRPVLAVPFFHAQCIEFGERGVFGRDFGDDAAVAQNQDAVGHFQQFFELGRHEDRRQALLRLRPDDVEDLPAGVHVDAAARLVEQHDLRSACSASCRRRPSAGCRPKARRRAASARP